MDNDVIHKADEFSRLPWATLDPERFGQDWTIGTGGYGLDRDSKHIDIISAAPDLRSEVWELPPALCSALRKMLDSEARNARYLVQQDIKTALDID
jgi:hypothetical protein